MLRPTMVAVLVSDGEGHKYSKTLPEPTFADFAAALGQLYAEVDRNREVAFVQSSFDTPLGRKVVGADEATDSADQVALVLWGDMLSDIGLPIEARWF
jgi:hypothetical protein